jgi:hypothetical protein
MDGSQLLSPCLKLSFLLPSYDNFKVVETRCARARKRVKRALSMTWRFRYYRD